MTIKFTLKQLGWRSFYQQQLTIEENEQLIPARILSQHCSLIIVQSADQKISLDIHLVNEPVTVGDWILLNEHQQFVRSLSRHSEFSRKAAGSQISKQLIASNIDTVFIVSSLNSDFNLSRIERFLALANEAHVEPVILLTKADKCADPYEYIDQIHQLDALLMVEAVNTLDESDIARLLPWCQTGQTIAFLGSSGVGKSTLINGLLGNAVQLTGGIREDDSKGKHTTTGRSLHAMDNGALLLDTPGMRELQLVACESGINETFSDISQLAEQCKFSNCSHQNEPKCAVRNALKKGDIDDERLTNYFKLQREQARNGATLAEQRAADKSFQKYITTTQKQAKAIKRYAD